MTLLPDNYGAGRQVRACFSKDGALYAGASGKARFLPLAEEIESKGGEFVYDVTVDRIVMADGKATGVQAVNASGVLQVDAKAILVCTGGFQGSPEKLVQYYGTFVNPLGNTLSTGEGLWRRMPITRARR